MDSPACFQAIYKHVGQQKIDVDVYLPSPQNSKRPVCTSAPSQIYGRYRLACVQLGILTDTNQ